MLRNLTTYITGLLLLVCSTVCAQRPAATYTNASIDIKTAVPVLSIETAGPSDINLGKTARFVVTVKNVGDVPAEGLIIRTELPLTVDYQNATPKPEAVEDGAIRFFLGDLKAQGSARITLNLLPTKQGPVNLETRASFSTSTKSSLRVRQSKLRLTTTGPARIQYGQPVQFKLVVTNKGDGPSENVHILPNVPDGLLLDKRAGKAVQIGVLPPGDSREMLYTINANATGTLKLGFTAVDASGAKSESEVAVRVMRPMLNLSIHGPAMRYVNRSGNFEIRVANPGDAAAHSVEVVASIPPGLRVVALKQAAKYDRDAQTLTWVLPELNAGSEQVLSLKAVATKVGEAVQHVVATNKQGLTGNAELTTKVASRPLIWATILNSNGATEVNQAANFTILIGNRGSEVAENVEVSAIVPDELKVVRTDDLLEINGGEIRFEPVTIGVGEQKELQFHAVGRRAGDHTVRITFKCDKMANALSAEGSAFVYDDREPQVVASRELNSLPPKPRQFQAPEQAPVTQPMPSTSARLMPTTPTPATSSALAPPQLPVQPLSQPQTTALQAAAPLAAPPQTSPSDLQVGESVPSFGVPAPAAPTPVIPPAAEQDTTTLQLELTP